MLGFFCVYGCGRGTPEEGGIARWMQSGMLLRFCEKDGEGRQRKVALVRGGMGSRDTRGRWHRSGQGLRRGILLGLRETAKSIAAGPELASGSDSRPCRNNAVSRSPSSNHPSSAAARSDATFLWLTLPADRKKPEYGTEANINENIKESRIQIGTAYHHKYRKIQKPDRHNVPF